MMKKRIFGIAAALILCLGILPMSAQAYPLNSGRKYVYNGQSQKVSSFQLTLDGTRILESGKDFEITKYTDLDGNEIDCIDVGPVLMHMHTDDPTIPALNNIQIRYDIVSAPLTVTGLGGSHTKEYDGKTDCDGTGLEIQFTGKFNDDDVTVKAVGGTYAYSDLNAGENKEIILSGAAYELEGNKAGNYYIADNPPDTLNASVGTITKGNYTGETMGRSEAPFGTGGSFDLSNLLPAGAVLGEVTVKDDGSIFSDPAPAVSDGILTYVLKADAAKGSTATITVKVRESANYKPFDLTVTVTVSDKFAPELAASSITHVYNGQTPAVTGTASVNGMSVPGTWAFQDPAPVNVADSGEKTVVFTPDDSENYASATAQVQVTIIAAPLNGAPTFNNSGKTLTEVTYTLPDGWPQGTFAWADAGSTAIEQGKEYGYTFTPDSRNYQTYSSTEILWARPSSSGGSSSDSEPTTYRPSVSQPDHGSVTVSPRNPQAGDKVTVKPVPDEGYEVDSVTVTDRRGRPVEVTEHQDGIYSFTQPQGTVTIEVELVPLAAAPWTSPYTDVTEERWYSEAVRFVTENGLMSGYDNQFAPGESLIRAQLAQVLYNYAGRPTTEDTSFFDDVRSGAWYSKSVAWAAEQGVVRGYGGGRFGPNDPITREQLAVMLWRYAGRPAPPNLLLPFSDADQVSDWAADALRWAVDRGILKGKGGGVLDPRGTATRAETAQIIKNFLEK